MPSLADESRRFGNDLQHLLEGSVADAATMTVQVLEPDLAILRPREPPGNKPWGYVTLTPPAEGMQALQLRLMYRLGMSRHGHLTVRASSFGVMVEPTAKGRCFLRIEYDRDKGNRFPEAHSQIDADSTLWGWALARSGQQHRDLHDLHFPSGGRRFRPALEDVIDFLVREGLTVGRPGWREVVDQHRAAFADLQVRATVRYWPEPAAETLAELGWSIKPPSRIQKEPAMADDDLEQARVSGGGTMGLHVHLMLDEDDPPKIDARRTPSKAGGRWLDVSFRIGPQMQTITLSGKEATLVAALRDALAQVQMVDEAGPETQR